MTFGITGPKQREPWRRAAVALLALEPDGSRVIRGNLLVIPIEDSILYVSPLYLRAMQGHLPELKRVIAAYGEHVVMKETLAEALSALFTEPGAAPAAPTTATGTAPCRGCGRSSTEGARSLQSSNGALEIRRLEGLWHGARRDARTFRGSEPAIERPLGRHRSDVHEVKKHSHIITASMHHGFRLSIEICTPWCAQHEILVMSTQRI
jgi:uncharacterized membrane protein (UPF0182 family)